VRILCLQDAAYPDRLRSIYNPPLVLYVRGTLPDIDGSLCVGVVGTRRAGGYGLQTAERLGRELAEGGAVVVTGIAEGIDTAAARGALKAGGRVVAVLGTGVDVAYPAWNSRLQRAVERSGALLSEYPPGARGSKFTFPMRNRIISGLCLGVAIVQAPEKSGALITAARAQEQGRDLFVVPGNVDDESFSGSNALIRDGACLIRSGADIIEEYRWRFPAGTGAAPGSTKLAVDNGGGLEYIDLMEQLGQLSENEAKAVAALAGSEMHADELIEKTGLKPEEALAALTLLELRGCVEARADGRFRLIIKDSQR
jgi:DNA processing protein